MQEMQRYYELFSKYPQVITDSRKVVRDCLFFALKGGRFNGNEFAEGAIRQGAAYAFIDEKEYQKGEQFILVEDVMTTLQQLASYHRQQFHVPVIGITGSNGKTTTKELISAVLSSHYKTHFTKGNFNNHIGVPLTLLAMQEDVEVAIIEMGANHQGEIDFLCNIAQPTHGLITNIGKAHLEGFGGIEGVKKGKSELYRYLAKNNGVAFVNQDENFLEELAKDVKWKIFYRNGEEPTSHNNPFEIQLISLKPFITAAFTTDINTPPVTINSHLIGQYNFGNIMTAIVLGIYFKVPSIKIKKAIEGYVPSNNRSQIVNKGSNTFILDAYNANPSSVENAIRNFSKMEGAKKVAVLGAMKELGEYSEAEHANIFKIAKELGFEKIILVGAEYRGLNDMFFESTEELKKWFETQVFENTYFLIKGSRSIGLEKLLTDFS